MPKPAEIVAALGDLSAIDDYVTLKCEMVDLFDMLADCMKGWSDERPAQIMRKMTATIETVPYDVLVELGHSYSTTLICFVLMLHVVHRDVPDYADAHDLVLTLLDELRGINLEHPDTQKAIEQIEAILRSARRHRPD
jgi:hypothetical protein